MNQNQDLVQSGHHHAGSPLIKIMIVCTVPTDRSGIPAVIFNLLTHMDLSGLDITYVSINTPDIHFIQLMNSLGIRYIVIPRELRRPMRYVRKLASAGKGFDIIHVHGNSATMLLEMTAAKMAGIPVRIAHAHSTSCNMHMIDKLARPLFYRLCTHRIACSDAAGRFLYRQRTFYIVKNAVDASRFAFDADKRLSMRQRLDLSNRVVFGHVGNFVDAKNHLFLLDIFDAIAKKIKNATLLLVGDGNLKSQIIEKINRLNISGNVILTGSVDNPQDYLQAMDMILMPSLYEGMPLSMIEQQANGLSILASDIITPQINISGNVHFESLKSSPAEWSDKAIAILKSSDRSSDISNEEIITIKRHGFDLNDVAANLKDFYMNTIKSLSVISSKSFRP